MERDRGNWGNNYWNRSEVDRESRGQRGTRRGGRGRGRGGRDRGAFVGRRMRRGRGGGQIQRSDTYQHRRTNNDGGVVCCTCGAVQPAYRCPSCLLKYCSVPCYKSHRLEGNQCVQADKKDGSDTTCTTPFNKRDTDGSMKRLATTNKETYCDLPNSVTGTEKKTYLYPTKDTVRPEGLQALTEEPSRSKLMEILESPRLKDQILRLNASSDPRSMLNALADDKEFSTFRTFIVENLTPYLHK